MQKLIKVLLAVVVTGVLGYFLIAHLPDIKKSVSVRDSIAYWAAGKLLTEHKDPYNPGAVLQLERQYGYSGERPLVLRTPPWSLCMVVLLGFLRPLWAWLLWMALTLVCLLAGMRLSRRMYGSGPIPPNLLTLVGYTFAPVAACLVSGQMGLLLLLGLVLFLWWEPDRPFLAGASLVLPFAKPHLLALFWIIALLWAVLRKKRKILLGFVGALAAAVALALFLDHHIFEHYRQMLYAASIQNEFIPALSGVVRLIFFRRLFWVQFIPLIAGLTWSLWFFFRRQSEWNWRLHGPAVLVVSVLTTPYAWLADETVLLPAVLQAAAFLYQARHSMKIRNKVAVAIYVFLDLLLLLILRARVPFATGIYFWSGLVWFFWYFHAYKLHLCSDLSRPQFAP